MEIIFKKCQEISYHKNILTLLGNAFEDKVFAQNTKNAFFNGYCSEYPNFVIIEHRRIPIAVAIVALRQIHFFGTIAKAMTVGPFAVAQNMQNQGLGRKLMEGIEDLAKKLSVDLLYLVGIKGFYKSLGFKTFMQRSKIVLNPEEINEGSSGSIQAFDGSYRDDSVESFQNLSSLCNFSSKRTDCDWDWLLGHATNSYYFYKPIVVLDENANFVGYFTHDPNDPGRLREVVYQLQDNKIETFLCGLRQYASALKIDQLEIMTPPSSPLHTYCKINFNFSFVALHNVDAGHMVKGLTKETIKKIQNASCSLPAFIFQGDNF